jgi:hypothetical protein
LAIGHNSSVQHGELGVVLDVRAELKQLPDEVINSIGLQWMKNNRGNVSCWAKGEISDDLT